MTKHLFYGLILLYVLRARRRVGTGKLADTKARDKLNILCRDADMMNEFMFHYLIVLKMQIYILRAYLPRAEKVRAPLERNSGAS